MTLVLTAVNDPHRGTITANCLISLLLILKEITNSNKYNNTLVLSNLTSNYLTAHEHFRKQKTTTI